MNFAIYKKIKNVWGKLASLEKDEQRLFVYLKQAATLKTVLSLAKLYDKKNKKYPTRCIESLFEELEKSDFEIQNNYVDQLNWDKFSKSNTLVIKTIFNGDEPNAKEFIPYFKHYIEESMKKEIEPFKTLKTWRDKRIAHNENFDETVSISDDQIDLPISLPTALIKFIDDFIPNSMITASPANGSYFIDEMIEKYCG
jgi:hypothetical protein